MVAEGEGRIALLLVLRLHFHRLLHQDLLPAALEALAASLLQAVEVSLCPPLLLLAHSQLLGCEGQAALGQALALVLLAVQVRARSAQAAALAAAAVVGTGSARRNLPCLQASLALRACAWACSCTKCNGASTCSTCNASQATPCPS